jgi:hypothetical protein
MQMRVGRPSPAHLIYAPLGFCVVGIPVAAKQVAGPGEWALRSWADRLDSAITAEGIQRSRSKKFERICAHIWNGTFAQGESAFGAQKLKKPRDEARELAHNKQF